MMNRDTMINKEIRDYREQLSDWVDYLAVIRNMTDEEVQAYSNTDETKEEAIANANAEINMLTEKIDSLVEDLDVVADWGYVDPAYN